MSKKKGTLKETSQETKIGIKKVKKNDSVISKKIIPF